MLESNEKGCGVTGSLQDLYSESLCLICNLREVFLRDSAAHPNTAKTFGKILTNIIEAFVDAESVEEVDNMDLKQLAMDQVNLLQGAFIADALNTEAKLDNLATKLEKLAEDVKELNDELSEEADNND